MKLFILCREWIIRRMKCANFSLSNIKPSGLVSLSYAIHTLVNFNTIQSINPYSKSHTTIHIGNLQKLILKLNKISFTVVYLSTLYEPFLLGRPSQPTISWCQPKSSIHIIKHKLIKQQQQKNHARTHARTAQEKQSQQQTIFLIYHLHLFRTFSPQAHDCPRSRVLCNSVLNGNAE